MFKRAEGKSFDYSSPVWSGIETSCTIDRLASGTYYFVVRAYVGRNESGDSNQIKVVIDDSLDSDKDGLSDTDEKEVFQTNPYDPDSDGDGYRDGEEVNAGTDPNDGSDHAGIKTGSSTVYEDAEDGQIRGWDIYDASPAGASIANVYDANRKSSVIELVSSGTSNGFRLRNEDGTKWNNSTHSTIQWSMKFSNTFVIYIDLETTAGHRYLVYLPMTMTVSGVASTSIMGLAVTPLTAAGERLPATCRRILSRRSRACGC